MMIFKKLRIAMASEPKSRSEFYETMGKLVANGMSAPQAAAEVHKRVSADKKSRIALLSDLVMQAINSSPEHSTNIGAALGRFVPQVEALAIDAGTQAGNMAEGFYMAKRLCDTTARSRSLVRGEVLIPLALSAILLGCFYFIGTASL